MMKIINASLAQSAVHPEQYPAQIYREVVMIGRSNVGKSSLINTLVNRNNLARTSAAPGKTRLINFFLVDAKNDEERFLWYLVDLPGYGYAKVSRQERDSWLNMINKYLVRNPDNKLCCQLVDIRHEPSVQDVEMCVILREAGYQVKLIATKADKITKSVRAKNIAAICRALDADREDLLVFSSQSKEGREELLDLIESFVLDK